MKYLSLFTGIGGFELGIQQAYENKSCNVDRGTERRSKKDPQGTKGQGLFTTQGKDTHSSKRPTSKCPPNILNERPLCVGFSEIDKYATAIYQSHFPTHQAYGDITKINEKELPDFDLLCGGFPCQSFSIAGKRGGFNDTRGTMFFEIARILKHKQPKLLLLENVKGLLSHDEGRTFTTIISTLDELGYDLQWQVLNSKDFGVPQNRERVFIIGHLRGTPRPQVFPLGALNEADIILPTLTTRYYAAQANGGYIRNVETQVGTYRTHKDGKGFRRTKSGLAPTIPARAREDGSGQPVIRVRETQDGFHQYRNDKKKSSIQGTHVTYPSGKSHALSTAHKPMTNVQGGVRRLTPIECERLQGFPDSWTASVSDTQRYKTLGNAVTVNVIRAIAEKLL